MKDKKICNYCIYCIYEKKKYHCRYQFEDYIVNRDNPGCEDFIEAETTAIQNKPFSLPRRRK